MIYIHRETHPHHQTRLDTDISSLTSSYKLWFGIIVEYGGLFLHWGRQPFLPPFPLPPFLLLCVRGPDDLKHTAQLLVEHSGFVRVGPRACQLQDQSAGRLTASITDGHLVPQVVLVLVDDFPRQHTRQREVQKHLQKTKGEIF